MYGYVCVPCLHVCVHVRMQTYMCARVNTCGCMDTNMHVCSCTRVMCASILCIQIAMFFIQEWKVTKLTFEQDPEPIWKERDDAVKALCKERDVRYVEKISHTLYDPQQ